MTPVKLKNLILSLTQDINFLYNGHDCTINPFSKTDIAMAVDDKGKGYKDVDDLMADPVFDGKSLNQIADKIELN